MNLHVLYRNWRGEVGWREVRPVELFWGKNDYHPEEQWLLHCLDAGKGEARTFALGDFLFVSRVPLPPDKTEALKGKIMELTGD